MLPKSHDFLEQRLVRRVHLVQRPFWDVKELPDILAATTPLASRPSCLRYQFHHNGKPVRPRNLYRTHRPNIRRINTLAHPLVPKLAKNGQTKSPQALRNCGHTCEPNALVSGVASGFGPEVARSSGILLMPDASANGSLGPNLAQSANQPAP